MFRHSSFPIENRDRFGELQSPGVTSACFAVLLVSTSLASFLTRFMFPDAVRQHMRKFNKEPYHHRLSDFHLLMYLVKLFDMQVRWAVGRVGWRHTVFTAAGPCMVLTIRCCWLNRLLRLSASV